VDDGTLFDLRHLRSIRATDHPWGLLDHQLDVGSPALVAHDPDIFETHQGGEDLTRVDEDEGAS